MTLLDKAYNAVREAEEADIEATQKYEEALECMTLRHRELYKAKSHLEFVRLNVRNPMPVPRKTNFVIV